MKKMIAMAVVCVAGGAFATVANDAMTNDPHVVMTHLNVNQRYPWNGKVDIDDVNAFLTGPEGLSNSMTGTGTVFLTYPGRIANNPISRLLLAGLSPGILAAERAVDVYAHRDSLIIQVSQKGDDLSLVDAMRRTLENQGFAVRTQDLGRTTQNVFDFGKIKRV